MKPIICVVTGARAEYGILRPLIVKLQSDERFELRLVVTGKRGGIWQVR